MNIGKELVNFRKEKGLTQEEFGNLFHVTRQTVSSWENEKRYPDIKTIIAISDYMDISLDRLLKEDREMINVIDKDLKFAILYKRLTKGMLLVFLLLVCSSIVYFQFWNLEKSKLETRFSDGCESIGFDFNEVTGVYNYSKENIKYTLPNQKMPDIFDFHFDFEAKMIDAAIIEKDEIINIRYMEGRFFGISFNNKNVAYMRTGEDSYNVESMSLEEQEIYSENLELISTTEQNLIKYYKMVYQN